MITVTWSAEFFKNGTKELLTRKFEGIDLDECLRQMRVLVAKKSEEGSALGENKVDKIES